MGRKRDWDRVGTITHHSTPVYEKQERVITLTGQEPFTVIDNILVGRDVMDGSKYRFVTDREGQLWLRLRIGVRGMMRTYGPFSTRSAAGRHASKKVIQYWENLGGKGWHPGKPKP